MSNELVKQISYILYSEPEENVKINAVIKDETIWLTQKAMAELFDCSTDNIGLHLKNVYDNGELERNRTTEEISVVQKEGLRDVKRKVSFYNLDAIISVGYRVNSAKATKFRIWATGILKEYIKKGFVLDDERLKQGETVFGKDFIQRRFKCLVQCFSTANHFFHCGFILHSTTAKQMNTIQNFLPLFLLSDAGIMVFIKKIPRKKLLPLMKKVL